MADYHPNQIQSAVRKMNRNNTTYRPPYQNRGFSGYQNRPFYRGRKRATNAIGRYNQRQQYNERQHDDQLLALQRCQLNVITLALTENARILGCGRWLINSASEDYRFIESAENGSNFSARIEQTGCRVCINTLGCGKQLRGPNIHLRIRSHCF